MDYEKLIKYGFIKKNNIYTYEQDIQNGEFKIIVNVSEKLTSKIIDNTFSEEFIMVGNGSFVNNIRKEQEKIIKDIIDKCAIKKISQLEIVNNYIKEKYKDEIEYLWKKYPDDGIYRNKKNQKWYALIMKIESNKIGINSTEEITILNLMYQKEKISEIIDNKSIYPGYHMNKKSWITIILNKNVSNKLIFKLIDNSYNISIQKRN